MLLVVLSFLKLGIEIEIVMPVKISNFRYIFILTLII